MNRLVCILFSILIPVTCINISAAVIEGTVTDSSTGLPIHDVNILFTTNPGSSVPIGNNYKTITDSGGYYHISGVEPGVYVIIAGHENYETNMPEKLLVPDSTGMIIEYNFSLTPIINTGYEYRKIPGKVIFDNEAYKITAGQSYPD